MSKEYNQYLLDHIDNVQKGAKWMINNLPLERLAITEHDTEVLFHNMKAHDKSKYSSEEYEAYDNYFYGDRNADGVEEEFNYAWLHHIHNNPHHWQHWVLIHDDEPAEYLEMSTPDILEMIADWWAFSWKKGDLTEIFSWYEKHSPGMMLHKNTRALVENILSLIKDGISN